MNFFCVGVMYSGEYACNLVPRIFLWERPWLRLVTCFVKNLATEGVWGKYQITSTCFLRIIKFKILANFCLFSLL
jgi:hypothetical protein